MTALLRTLAAFSALELVSVIVLFGNLATVHDHTITTVVGPVHGAIYLTVAVTALLGRNLAARTRIGALIPVLSGPLTMVNVRREARAT